MIDYLNLIDKEIRRYTSIEQSVAMKSELNELRIKMMTAKTLFDVIETTPDFTTIGDMRAFFDSCKKIIER